VPALDELIKLLRGDHALIVAQERAESKPIFEVSAGLDDSQVRCFHSPQVMERALPYLHASPNKVAVNWSQVLPDREFERTVFYNEVVRQLDGFYAITARYETAATAWYIAVCRSRRAGNFENADTAKLQMLLPHFGGSVDLYHRLRAADHHCAGLAAVLDSLLDGIILTDGAAKPIFLNATASRVTAGRGLLFIDSDRLATADHETTRRLREAISAVGRGTRQDWQLRLDRPPNVTLLLSILPAHPLGISASRPHAARVAIFIKQQAAQAVIDSAAAAEMFQLTRRESEIAALLAAGVRLGEIAARLGVGYNTVRSHLARALEKTGTHSQVELVAAVRNVAGRRADQA
jgi:DNA-binding CsgD family transcriptional regulator